MNRAHFVFVMAILVVLTMSQDILAQPKEPASIPTHTDLIVPVKPGAGLTLLGEPDVTNWTPKEYAVQGEIISFFGTLKASEFHATFGQPPIPLPLQAFGPGSTPASFIRVRVPENVGPQVGPLTVRYGINGPRRTLDPSYKVLKKPRVASFRIVDGPHLELASAVNRPTKIEIGLLDFDPTVDTSRRPTLAAPECKPGASYGAASEVGGNPYRLQWDFHFTGSELSGRRCAMEIHPYGGSRPAIPAGEVALPSVSTYTVSNTWDLVNFTTPSGRKFTASGGKGALPCQLGSVGTAGTFATGVVNDGGDLSFQLRNGLLQEECRFETSIPLEVKTGWIVKSVGWQFTRDSLCSAAEFAVQTSSGSTVTFFNDQTAVFKVRFDASCRPSGTDPARNSHVYKAKLESVQLVGPAGMTWQDAFK
jgi:hypothetical protein